MADLTKFGKAFLKWKKGFFLTLTNHTPSLVGITTPKMDPFGTAVLT